MADDKNELMELYVQGTESFDSGNYVKAEGLLNEVNRLNPNFADVNNKLGVIANLKGNVEEAALFFERALALNPAYTEAAVNLTITYNELGRTEDAGRVYAEAAKPMEGTGDRLDPFSAGKLANEHYRLGNIYMDYAMPEDAMEEYRKALRRKPELVDVRTKLGMALRDLARYDEAEEELRKALETNPRYGRARSQLGLVLQMKGEKAAAIAEWEAALAENPDLREARNFLKFFKDKE